MLSFQIRKLSVFALIPLAPPIKPWPPYVHRGVCWEVGSRPKPRNSGPGPNALLLMSASLKAATSPLRKAAAQPLQGGKDGDVSPAASWPVEVLPKGL